MTTYTSRSRFDEARRFTGVYQQMGRMVLDSDWNEEIRIRTTDARRRTSDVAEGAPDDGFRITDTYVLDATSSTAGWSGVGLDRADARYIPPELTLDRKEPASLPFVVRSRGHVSVQRTFASAVDLQAVPARPGGTPGYRAAALVMAVRFEVPANEQETTDVRLLVSGPRGQVAVPLAVDPLPSTWHEVRIPMAALATLTDQTTTLITSWGLTGLPPRATVWLDSLRVEPAGMDRSDFAILGGDGTLAGAGRMFVGGVRAFIEADRHYLGQADYPDPVALADLAGATPPPAGGHYLVYLDVWERPVTALEDDFLAEPALDGLDTTTRLKLVQQVKVAWIPAGGAETLPASTGGGALTTSFAAADPTPLRYAADRVDPSRLGGLFTESIATQTGYRGDANVHVRVEVLAAPGGQRVVLWSRDNASTAALLAQDAPASATSVVISPDDAARFAAGDLIVLEDAVTRLQPEGPRRLRLARRIVAVDPDTGTLSLGVPMTHARVGAASEAIDPTVALPTSFQVAQAAAVRRWDGADWLVTGQRYNLTDGIEFALSGDPASFRPADHWSFTARIHGPDGQAQGVVEALVAAPPAGPVHRYAVLGRVSEAAGVRAFEDVRPRFLPLASVRDRLRELETQAPDKGPFAVVVGDGVSTFGDVDQDTVEGVTGDEAIQSALTRLQGTGGTLYVRAGVYLLERPVLVQGMSRVRIVGDGDGTVLRALGTGGAVVFYACGKDGEVSLEHLSIREEPLTKPVIGLARAVPAPPPPERPLALTDLRLVPTLMPVLSPIAVTLKLIGPGQGRTFASVIVSLDRLRVLQKAHPGQDLATLPEAAAILGALEALPHGVVTVADSRSVRVVDCHLHVEQVLPADPAVKPPLRAFGVFVTGTSSRIEVARNRIEAPAGVVASPLTAYFSDDFLAQHPAAALSATDLRITDNDLLAWGSGVYGVWIGDGTLSGVRIGENRIQDFAVGIEVGDRTELRGADPAARIEVVDNRVVGSIVTGILVGGDGVDVAGNEIRNAAAQSLFGSSGLFHAAIQVTGQGVRVRDSWIELPAVTSAPALGVYAGIVIGDGLDDGRSTSRAVHDVEVTGNRIEGAGAATPATGVLVGGPQPVLDVRVRSNVIRNLGDAGVRLLGTGLAATRILVEDNRVEEVALADVTGVDPDLRAQIELLAPGLSATLDPAAFGGPQALLSALVVAPAGGTAPDPARARGVIDAALRWVERLTLRGGIVTSGAEDTRITGNRVVGVGHYDNVLPTRTFTAEVRTAGVGVVGGSNVRVQDNHLEEVRAAVGNAGAPPSPLAAASVASTALTALSAIGRGNAVGPDSSAELHAAAAGLHGSLLAAVTAVVGSSTQALPDKYANSVFGSLDAMNAGLVALNETSFAQSFGGLIGQLRTTPTGLPLVTILDGLRVHLAHVALVTAASPASAAGWQAVEDMEGAIVAGDAPGTAPATVSAGIGAAAAAIDARSEVFDGLTDTRAGGLHDALRALTPQAATVAAARQAAQLLADAAAVRDEADLDTGIGAGDVQGHRVDIVTSLASGLQTRAGTIPADPTAAAPMIAAMRPDVSALVQVLQESGADLSRYLLADFGAVDQAVPQSDPAHVSQLGSTLGRVVAWAKGQPASSSDADALRLSHARQDASVQLLGVDDLDQRISQLGALGEVSDALAAAAVGAVKDEGAQLAALLQGSSLAPLATQLTTALAAAGTSSGTARQGHLDDARGFLAQIRLVVGDLASAAKGTAAAATPTDLSERRMAGLGALVLALRELGAGSDALRTQVMDALTTHVGRAVDETDGGNALRRTALDTVAAAKAVVTSASSAAPAFAAAVDQLATMIDGIASNLADAYDSPGMLAAAALLHAATLGLDAGGTSASRRTTTLSFLASRKAMVSPAVVDRLTAAAAGSNPDTGLDALLAALRQALERLAVGEATAEPPAGAPFVPDLPEPADGIFAAAVEDQLRIESNAVQTALNAIVVTGPAGHVLAAAGAASAPVLIEVLGNQLRGAAVGAIDVYPGADAVVTVADNQVTGCVDQAAPAILLGRAGAPALLGALSQAVARLSGQGALVVQGNVLQGNGHGFPAAILHEVLADWRGDAVVRGNTIQHTGGGAGGVALLLLVETLDPIPASAASLVQRLSTAPALAVEPPPPAGGGAPPPIRTPWRALSLPPPAKPKAVAVSHYLTRVRAVPSLGVAGLLVRRPPPRVPPAPPPGAPRSTAVEGNHVRATGPALLLLGTGADAVAASVTSNTLASVGSTGAVYLRYPDATVFASNRCESAGSVNVVVARLGAAPASVSGNVILGDQPVAQTDPVVLGRRNDLKQFVGLEIARQAGALADVVSATATQQAPPPGSTTSSVAGLFGALGKSVQTVKLASLGPAITLLGNTRATQLVSLSPPAQVKTSQFVLKKSSLSLGTSSALSAVTGTGTSTSTSDTSASTSGGGSDASTGGSTPTSTAASVAVSPALIAAVSSTAPPPPPDPRAQSLVILGGTRVTSLGNATTAGALVSSADNSNANNL